MKSGLSTRISLAMVCVSTLSTVLAFFLAGSLLIRSHRDSIRQQLQASAASLISLGISDFSELQDFNELDRFIETALQMEKADKIVRIFDQKRKLVFTTVGFDYDMLPSALEEGIKLPVFMTMSGKNTRYETLVLPYQVQGKKKLFYLQIAIPLPKYSEILKSLWWQSLLLLGLLFLISLALSQWLARRLIKPIGQVAYHLTRLDPDKIEAWRPLALDARGRYLDAITSGINLLTERTQAAVQQIRKMSRYVAHEMRTPLTIMQGEAETVLVKPGATREDYAGVVHSSLEEVQRMSEIVDTVLQVGEPSRARALYHPVPLQLTEWLPKSLRYWERTLGRPIETQIPANGIPVIQIDAKMLFRLIDNLIRNVRLHTPADTCCLLEVKAGEEGVRIVISDEGPHLSQKVIDTMNQKESALETTGVGLHLCHTIAEVCALNLSFSKRPGGGLQVELVFRK